MDKLFNGDKIESNKIPLREFNKEQAEAFQAQLVDLIKPFKGRVIDGNLREELATTIGRALKKSLDQVPYVMVRTQLGEEPNSLTAQIVFMPEPEGDAGFTEEN